MSLEKVNLLKSQKLYKIGDVFIYITILLVVLGLFLGVFLTKNKEDIQTIEIIQNDKLCFMYDFNDDSYKIIDNKSSYDVNNSEKYMEVTIYVHEDRSHYNKIKIDKNNREVTLLDANCSSSKDCKYMSIKKCGDTIICAPHKLIIQTNFKDIKDPQVG